MVSIQEFRSALGPAADGRSDEDLCVLRDQYYDLGRAMLGSYRREQERRAREVDELQAGRRRRR
jgi:hypothetical protein